MAVSNAGSKHGPRVRGPFSRNDGLHRGIAASCFGQGFPGIVIGLRHGPLIWAGPLRFLPCLGGV